MPTTEDYEAVMSTLADWAEDIGDTVVGENEPDLFEIETEDGELESVGGHRVQHGDNIYFVVGAPDNRFLSVTYPLSLLANLTSSIPVEIAEVVVDDSIDEEEVQFEAAKILLNEVPQAEMEQLNYHLFMIVSAGSIETTIDRNEKGSIVSFNVSRKIFPYEDSFRISHFNDAVQQVVTAGVRGAQILQNSVHLEIDEDDPRETKLEINLNY